MTEDETKENINISKLLDLASKRENELHPSIDYINGVNGCKFMSVGTPLPIEDGVQTLLITKDSPILRINEDRYHVPKDKMRAFTVPLVKRPNKDDFTAFIIRKLAKELDKNGLLENKRNLTEIYNDLKKRVGYYWYHEEPWQIFTTCWIIGTYFHRVFSVFPHFIIRGERESGKSTILHVIKNFTWNPMGIDTNLRPAPMFRSYELERPTHLIDITRVSKAQRHEVGDVFEAGAEKGGSVPRCVGDNNEIVRFPVYCPKAVACREKLDFTPKGIEIMSVKPEGDKLKKFTKRREQIVNGDEKREEIVEALLRATLTRYDDVLEAYEDIKQSDELLGRVFRMFRSVLAIAEVFAPEKDEQKLVSKAKEYAREGVGAADKMTIVENATLRALKKLVLGRNEKVCDVLFSELSEEVKNELDWSHLNPNTLYSAVSNLGIIQTRGEEDGKRKYWVKMGKLVNKIDERGLTGKPESLDSSEFSTLEKKIIEKLDKKGALGRDQLEGLDATKNEVVKALKSLRDEGVISSKGSRGEMIVRLEVNPLD